MAQAGMTYPTLNRFQSRLRANWIAIVLFGLVAPLSAQTCTAQNVSPMSLIPDTAAGALRVPDMPKFCEAWKTTTLYSFIHDDAMKPFMDAQKAQAEKELLAADLKVGIKIRDLLEIASGEAAIAWLPFKDPRRPFSVVVVADVRGLKAKATASIDQVDADLKQAGATRTDVTYGADTIRVYSLKQKPGQLKIEQVAITLNDDRLIASDRDSVVKSFLDTVAGKSTVAKLVDSADYTQIIKQIQDRPVAEGKGGILGLEWFARPLSMAKIVKDAIGIDRGRQVDVLNLLERQGFDAVRAAGGRFTIAHADFDLLHHGFILAPPTTNEPSKYKLGARMLQFPNVANGSVPAWVGEQIASLTRLNWKMGDAFWASETLINDAFGDEIFRDIFDGIRDDEDGPKIDMQKNVIPNLGEHLYLLTDNKLPADKTSERLLVAVEVINAAAIRDAVKRAMEVEPDATLIDGVPGTEIYRVLRTDEPTDFDAELFQDIGLDEGPDPDAPPPLLNQWAITVINNANGPGGYLVFSSHPELLVETATLMLKPPANGLAANAEIQTVMNQLKQIGGEEFAMKRVVRTNVSLRVKYMLLRQAKLRESDSLLASLFRRTFDDLKNEDEDPLNAKKLPPFEQVEKYFRPAGTYVKTDKDGWVIDGFLLK
jgi:hypothetical protein